MKRCLTVLFAVALCLAGCSANNSNESGDDTAVNDAAPESINTDLHNISVKCSGIDAYNGDYDAYTIPTSIGKFSILNITKTNDFLVWANGGEAGVLHKDGTYKPLIKLRGDYEDISVIFSDNEHIVYLAYETGEFNGSIGAKGDGEYEIRLTDYSSESDVLIYKTEIKSRFVPSDAVIVDNIVYFDIVDHIDEQGYAVQSLLSYDMESGAVETVSENGCAPYVYGDGLAYVEDTRLVLLKDGVESLLVDLKDTGLYREIDSLYISDEVIAYSYPVYDPQNPEWCNGAGVGYLDDLTKKHNIADDGGSVCYFNTVSFDNDLAVWNDSSSGRYPMFYDRKSDKIFVIYGEEELDYQCMAANGKLYFVYPDENEARVITVDTESF